MVALTMKNNWLLLLSICLCMACNPDKNTKIDKSMVAFKTTDSSQLYFKNVRQAYYDKEVMEAAKLEVYWLEKRNTSDEEPIINLSIVNNWRFDEAYILLEPNAIITSSDINIRWVGEGGNEGAVTYSRGNKSEIVKFADVIYDQIQQKSQFEIQIGENWVPFIASSEDREAFRITMFDYYSLVQRL